MVNAAFVLGLVLITSVIIRIDQNVRDDTLCKAICQVTSYKVNWLELSFFFHSCDLLKLNNQSKYIKMPVFGFNLMLYLEIFSVYQDFQELFG